MARNSPYRILHGMLLIFNSSNGIYFLTQQTADVTQWSVQSVSDVMGVAGPGCVISIDNDIPVNGHCRQHQHGLCRPQRAPTGYLCRLLPNIRSNANPWIKITSTLPSLANVRSPYTILPRERSISQYPARSNAGMLALWWTITDQTSFASVNLNGDRR